MLTVEFLQQPFFGIIVSAKQVFLHRWKHPNKFRCFHPFWRNMLNQQNFTEKCRFKPKRAVFRPKYGEKRAQFCQKWNIILPKQAQISPNSFWWNFADSAKAFFQICCFRKFWQIQFCQNQLPGSAQAWFSVPDQNRQFFFQCKKVKKDVCGPDECPIRFLPEICTNETKLVRSGFLLWLGCPE